MGVNEVLNKWLKLVWAEVTLPSWSLTSTAPFIRLECGETERLVTCKDCGTPVPKDMPRFYIYEHFWGKGHLCISCGLVRLQREAERLLTLQQEIKEKLNEYLELEALGNEILSQEDYQKRMTVARMLKKMVGR